MPAMLDWLTLSAPLTTTDESDYRTGGILSKTNHHNKVEYCANRWLHLRGSYDDRLSVRCQNNRLELSGNPAKWLQGHSLFGPSGLQTLVPHWLTLVADKLGLAPTDTDRAAWLRGDYRLYRVDCTAMYDLGSAAAVRQWLAAAGPTARLRRLSRTLRDDTSITFGEHSTYTTVKFYAKDAELRKAAHKPSILLSAADRAALTAWAANKLRFEVVLHSRELHKRGLDYGRNWSPTTPDTILNEYLAPDSLTLAPNAPLPNHIARTLPPNLIPVYETWRAGHDLARVWTSPTTRRNYRNALLPYGVDIDAAPAPMSSPPAPPLKAALADSAAAPPAWAIGTPLLALSGPQTEPDRAQPAPESPPARTINGSAGQTAPGAAQSERQWLRRATAGMMSYVAA